MNKKRYIPLIAIPLIVLPLTCSRHSDRKTSIQSTNHLDNIVSCVSETNMERVYCELLSTDISSNTKPNTSRTQLKQSIKDKLSQGEMEKMKYHDFVIEKLDSNNIVICSQSLNYIDINKVIDSIETKLGVRELIGIEKDYVTIGDYELTPETKKDIKQYENFQQKVWDSLEEDFLKQSRTKEEIGELVQKTSYNLLPQNTPEKRKKYLIKTTKEIFQTCYPIIEDPIDVDYLLNSV